MSPGEEPEPSEQPDDEMPTGQAFLDAYFTPELVSEPDWA